MNGKKIVVIGGGHGTSTVLSGLSAFGVRLSAVLSMADDGGSTGRLREELGISAVGDIRQCLVTLSARPEIAELFKYRFEKGSLSGHSLGNLFLGAGELKTGSLEKSIERARELLGVKEEILPSTEDKCHLVLEIEGVKVRGVFDIANTDFKGKKPALSLSPPSKISTSAQKALEGADFIVLAPGNFYCSIIPALLVGGLAETIKNSDAKVIQVCNLVNRAGQTGGYKVQDYTDEIKRFVPGLIIDAVIYNDAPISQDHLREGEQPVGVDTVGADYKLIGRAIADKEKPQSVAGDKIAQIRSLVRHDKTKLAETLIEVMDGL